MVATYGLVLTFGRAGVVNQCWFATHDLLLRWGLGFASEFSGLGLPSFRFLGLPNRSDFWALEFANQHILVVGLPAASGYCQLLGPRGFLFTLFFQGSAVANQ